MPLEDTAVKIREGEELPKEALAAYLARETGEAADAMEVRQFPGGYSNLTYLVKWNGREYVLRRPPHGTKAATAHDMSREFRVLSALHGAFPVCPRPWLYCDDPSVMGAPFYLMERIKGIILRKKLPPELGFTPKSFGKLLNDSFELMARLHSLDYQALGLGDFGKPAGYVNRQVAGWSKRYRAARTPDAADFEAVMEWLAANQPPEKGAAVIHNDFKLDNLVLDQEAPSRVIGLLDWEMSTVGDPLMDLGSSLGYWVQADDPPALVASASVLSHLPGAPTRAEVVRIYAQASGRSMDDFPFYFTFGLFRLAVIAQQIYYRFYHGQTKDPRFGALIHAVNCLDAAANRAKDGWGL